MKTALLVSLLLLLNAAFVRAEKVELPNLSPLPKVTIDADRITVSGVSSGAFFAQQFQVAHSALVKGVASVAGGYYWCAEGDSLRAQKKCMFSANQVDPKRGIEKAELEAKAGRIDSTENLRRARVVIFSSPKDIVVNHGHASHIEAFYKNYLADEGIFKLTHPQAAHGFPTKEFGLACDKMGSPWMNACQLDLAGEILQTLDEGKDRAPSNAGNTIYFSQKPYQTPQNQIYDWGAVYVPAVCQTEACGLHVAFHGCQMNPDSIGKQFIESSGYLSWADRKGIVVLFPQNSKGPGNSQGCWDWFGFTDAANYMNQQGPQIKAIRALLKDLSGI